MTREECINIFRDECREHLPWEEAQTYLGLFETRQNWKIFEEMNLLKKSGRISSPRFAKAIETFYWLFTG
jgi:hypothetical protein